MSDTVKDARPLRTIREQEVQIVLENLTSKNGGRKPSWNDVSKEIRRLKFKQITRQHFGNLLNSLKLKGYVRETEPRLEIVEPEEVVA